MVKIRKFWLPFLLVIMIYFMLITSFSKMIINIDGKKIEFWTRENTVKKILDDLNLVISPFDQVTPSLSSNLKGQKEINIKKGHEINLFIDGEVKKIITTAVDVKEVLRQNNINLNSLDIVKPALSTKITEGLKIRIVRVTEKIIETKESIPFKTKYKDDKNLWQGQSKLIKKGKNGIIAKTYLIELHDGQEVKKELLKEKIIQEPVLQIVLKGSKQTVQRAGDDLHFSQTLILNSTAYTHTGNKTYTDVWPEKGTVAVDPRVIPLGTRLYIDGYGFAIAEDIGSSIKGNRIDLFMESKAEALKWGRRPVRVFILE